MLFIFATNSHAGGRTEVYAHYPESGYTEHIGTVYYNHGTGSHGYTDRWEAAYAFMDQSAQRGYTVAYSPNTTSSGRCGEYGNPPCKSKNLPNPDPKIQGLIDSVEHQVSDSVLWNKLKSVVLIDDVYALIDSATEGTLVGTAAHVQLDTGYVVRRTGHTFSTLYEAHTYLNNRASSGAVVIPAPLALP